MGGEGKTQSASFFARKNSNRYKYIFFVDASSVESIKADLQSAIRSLGGPHSQGTFEDALRFLAQPDNRDWLVIFDNADDPDLPLSTHLPKCNHGTTIVTGRNHGLIQLAPASYLHLQGMDESHSIQVLLKAAQRDFAGNEEELKSATELCRLLGGLPLALVQVGCYCYTTQISFSQYLERFKVHRARLMEIKPPPQLDEYSYSTYTSINLSYSLLDERARSLLHLLAFFHYSSICLDMLQTIAKYGFTGHLDWEILPRDEQYGEQLNALRRLLIPNGSWNDVYVDDVLQKLQKCSLISLSHSNGQTNVTLHPLVQSCILDTLSLEDYSLYFNMAVLVLSSCSRDNEIHLFQHLPAHIAEMESLNVNIYPNDVAGFAYILNRNGNYEESMKRWARARDECKRVKGEEHRSTLQMSYWIADCLYHMYKNEEAETMIRGVVKTQGTVLGEDDDHTLESYQLLANILIGQDKTKEAETILKRVLALYESKYGQEHPRTLRIQSSLADNLRIQRRYSEAEALSQSVLPVMKRVLGEDGDTTLTTLNILSLALRNQGKLEEAEDISSDLVTRRIRIHGKQHPSTLNILHNLAICRFERGDLNGADRIFREFLEFGERTLGKDHPNLMITRRWLERVIQARDRLHSTDDRPPNPQTMTSPISPPIQVATTESTPRTNNALTLTTNRAPCLGAPTMLPSIQPSTNQPPRPTNYVSYASPMLPVTTPYPQQPMMSPQQVQVPQYTPSTPAVAPPMPGMIHRMVTPGMQIQLGSPNVQTSAPQTPAGNPSQLGYVGRVSVSATPLSPPIPYQAQMMQNPGGHPMQLYMPPPPSNNIMYSPSLAHQSQMAYMMGGPPPNLPNMSPHAPHSSHVAHNPQPHQHQHQLYPPRNRLPQGPQGRGMPSQGSPYPLPPPNRHDKTRTIGPDRTVIRRFHSTAPYANPPRNHFFE